LGGGLAPTPGHVNIDIVGSADIHWNLNKGLPRQKIFQMMKEGEVVEGIRALHVIEHLDSIIPLMNHCYEIMAPGSVLEISTPYAGTNQYWQDPTHKRGYVEESFLYFSKDSPYRKEQDEYGIYARFEIVSCSRGTGPDYWQLFVNLKR